MIDDIGQYMEVDKNKIKKNLWNPNYMTDDEEARLKTSMSRNGFLQTVLLYEDSPDSYTIIDGEHRWKSTPDGTKVRSIVVTDKDLDKIKSNLKDKENINIQSKDDILKHLTVLMNKLKGTMTPTKLGELIESLSIEETQKANLMLMDQQEIQFYSMIEEIEDEKKKIHEKEINQDTAEFIKWKVKDVTGLKSVILNIKDREFMIDGEKKELESLTMTVNGKLQSTINCRYKDIIEDDKPEDKESNLITGDLETDVRPGDNSEGTDETGSDRYPETE